MSKPPRRADIADPVIRATIEKLRGNTNVAMLQALGGEFIYDDAAIDRARGHAIEMEALDKNGRHWRLRIVPK
jgi:hypothetical protein